jgi:hypothetical protein
LSSLKEDLSGEVELETFQGVSSPAFGIRTDARLGEISDVSLTRN